MIWEITLQKEIDEATLKGALAAALHVSPDEVSVVDSIENAPSSFPVVAERRSIGGDFPCHLSLYMGEAFASTDELEGARTLCTLLDVQALISDKSLNPYMWLLIDKVAEPRPLEVDQEALDERNQFCLSREIPHA
jgi:hypothetical protein